MSYDFNNMDWSSLSKKTNFKEKKKFEADTRFWSLGSDENGKGKAIVRFLLDKDGVPFVNLKKVSFKAIDKDTKKYVWFIAFLPISIGEKCPLSDFRNALMKLGSAGKEEAKSFTYTNRFFGNLKVIKDELNPENDGKVFLFDFGSKVLEKMQESIVDDNKNPWNPLKDGCNVYLKRKMGSNGYPNWDSTSIEPQGAFMDFEDSDDAQKWIEENTYPLSEFMSKDFFDSYEDLKNRLKYFLSKYEPKHISKEAYQALYSEFFDEELEDSYKAKTSKNHENDDIDDIDEEVEEKPKTKKASTKNDDIEDDLDLDEDDEVKEEKKEKAPEPKKEEKKPVKKQDDDDDIDSLLEDL